MLAAVFALAIALPLAWAAVGGWQAAAAKPASAQPAPASGYTASRIEAFLAARHPEMAALATGDVARQLAAGAGVAWIGLPETLKVDLPAGVRRDVLDWSASPMAILRSDTEIHDWRALAGRKVCVAADGRHVGETGRRFGAREQVAPTMAAALLALRIGECDAAVADESFLQQLLTYPEWNKFSARLQPYRSAPLVLLARADLSWIERRKLARLTRSSALQAAGRTHARNIAFEVYLDQDAPDCH